MQYQYQCKQFIAKANYFNFILTHYCIFQLKNFSHQYLDDKFLTNRKERFLFNINHPMAQYDGCGKINEISSYRKKQEGK